MIEWLKSDAAEKPRVIAAAPQKPDPACGRVTSNIRHGELFLHPKGKRAERVRLRFEPKGDRERELPTGRYVVSGYRHVATAEDGAEWIWSTASPAYRQLEVKAGETVNLDVRTSLDVQARAFTNRKGQRRVGLVFMAEKRLGNTLYRKGRRIDITWQCLDAKDQVLADGTMRYG